MPNYRRTPEINLDRHLPQHTWRMRNIVGSPTRNSGNDKLRVVAAFDHMLVRYDKSNFFGRVGGQRNLIEKSAARYVGV